MRRSWLAAVAAAALALPACNSSAGGAQGMGSWTTVGRMHTAREGGGAGLGTATARLGDGRVLVAGGYRSLSGRFERNATFYLEKTEIFDPATGKWQMTGSMNQPRFGAAVVTLPKTGKVLAAGGSAGDDGVISPSAELYDPATGAWTFTLPMAACRVSPSASVLASGDVLVVGGVGCDGAAQTTAELYRSTSGEWVPAAPMATPRWGHSATVLADGRVLVAGGRSTAVGAPTEKVEASAEIYDPAADRWSPAAPMHEGRVLHAAGLLSSGEVVVAGGHPQNPSDPHAATASAELYDARANAWTKTGSMHAGREEGGSAVLEDGTFLMAGGGQQASAEIFRPSTGTWSLTEPMSTIHDDAQLTVLPAGDVLIAGGFVFGSHNSYRNTDVAELFHPQKG
ncbi:MAG TPA: kelch repeat-containing protein [Acidimicrobiales bacterium]|nr:kelch repeat-containing protein [Acidimicrobiales bacterium]